MTPIANLAKRLEQEIPLLTKELLDNLKDWREAQEQFRSVRRDLMARETGRGISYAIAEQRASVHPQIRDAITYTTYYREQSAMCASALDVLRQVREDMR